MTTLFAETIGEGQPTLVLLHGQSANGAVWKPLLRRLTDWPGRIVVPDLRGHGRSPHARHYGMAHHAADVADLFEPGTRLHLVGHSMGGAIALVLASGWFGIDVARVTAFGVKTGWTTEELQKAAEFAVSPVRWFDNRAAAAERFLRAAGLASVTDAADAAVDAGIVQEDGRWRLAADNATVRAAGTTVAEMLPRRPVPVRLFCGEHDPLVNVAALRAFDPEAFAIAGSGHNPHVQAPDEVAALVRKLHL